MTLEIDYYYFMIIFFFFKFYSFLFKKFKGKILHNEREFRFRDNKIESFIKFFFSFNRE
jgi:hypothetical protein